MKKRRITIADKLKEKDIEKSIKEKLNIDNDNKVIIEKKNLFMQILLFIENVLTKIIKLLFFISIATFSSIGLTIIINEPLRDEFINLLMSTFF